MASEPQALTFQTSGWLMLWLTLNNSTGPAGLVTPAVYRVLPVCPGGVLLSILAPLLTGLFMCHWGASAKPPRVLLGAANFRRTTSYKSG